MTTKTKKKEAAAAAASLLSEQHEAALQEYEKGVRLLQQKDFQMAIPRFEAILEKFPNEGALCDRARVYLRLARGEAKSTQPQRSTRNAADSYEVGVYLLNEGDLKEALRHLERAAEAKPEDASVRAALAIAHLNSGDVDKCLQEAQKAVDLDGAWRYRLRNMGDFDALEDNPEFSSLVADLE